MGSANWEPQPATGSCPDPLKQNAVSQTPEELREESRKIRRFQMVMSMVTQVIAQDPTVTFRCLTLGISDSDLMISLALVAR